MAFRSRSKPKIGIISGAGPEAGIALMQEVLKTHRARLGAAYKTDRDAPGIILFQVPGLGGPREKDDLFDEACPAFELVWTAITDTIRALDADANGISHFCIACNTLHVLEAQIRAWCKAEGIVAEFVSLIECVERALTDGQGSHVSEAPAATSGGLRVAILGTQVTTDVGVEGRSPYRAMLNRLEAGACRASSTGCWAKRVELDTDLRAELQQLIGSIKERTSTGTPHASTFRAPGDVADGSWTHALWFRAIMEVAAAAATATTAAEEAPGRLIFVLACTELPMLLPSMPAGLGQHRFLDPGALIAEKLVDVGLSAM